MKNKTLYNISIATLAGLMIFPSCRKTNNDPSNPPVTLPQEQITTVIFKGHLTSDPLNPLHQFSYQWEDTDGIGGQMPVIDTIRIDTGIRYTVSLVLLDKTKNPWDSISVEIAELGNVHRFFYDTDEYLDDKLKIEITDFDNLSPAQPIGLHTTWDTRSLAAYPLPAIGNLRLVLSHYVGIPKSEIPSPDTDIDILFPVVLK